MSYIKRNYTNTLIPGSYSGQSGFLKNTKHKDKKLVKQELESLDAYTLHKDIRRKFQRRKIKLLFINNLWSSDLKDIRKYSKHNNGIKYLLIVIDAFSKMAYVEQLKKKDTKSVIAAFSRIIGRAGEPPNQLWVDRGTEYTSSEFKKFLRDKKIKMYHTYSKMKSVYAERLIRTLFSKIARYMTQNNTNKFIDKLDDFVNTYNKTFHSSIQCSPESVTKDNQMEIFKILNKDILKDDKVYRAKFKIGDLVRISRDKLIFEKGKYD